MKKHQFTTPFVYEVSSDWGIEILEYMNPKNMYESKDKLIELYSCWVGEESISSLHSKIPLVVLASTNGTSISNYFNGIQISE